MTDDPSGAVVEQSIGPDEPFNPGITVQAQNRTPGVRITSVVAYVEYLDPDGKRCVERVTDLDLSDARVKGIERKGRKQPRREQVDIGSIDLSQFNIVPLAP